jgi:hypothetical protein
LIVFALFPWRGLSPHFVEPGQLTATQTLIPPRAGSRQLPEDHRRSEFTGSIRSSAGWELDQAGGHHYVVVDLHHHHGGYAFSQFRFRQRHNMLRAILLIQVFPACW